MEQLQRKCLTKNLALRENNLQRPAKGGSTPAFACQHAAIAPLPCLNLQLISQKKVNCKLDSFKKCNCSRKNKSQKSNLLRKCGLLAHTSPAFLKNCWIKKLLFTCGSYHKLLFFRSFIASSKKLRANISHCSQLYSITNSFLTSFQIP